LGRFDLSDIPPAPRGMPQIEVTFDIDANGILNVSAKDKATGKAQSIVIKASSGLSDEEIEQMVKDAEAHADEDRKFQELVNARNQADALVHAARSSLTELGEKLSDAEKQELESAIAAAEEAIKGDDVAAIEASAQKLAELSGNIAQKAQAAGEAPGSANHTGPQAADDDNVVDADFEEIKDEK
jgi:molecular chaperone DnaK